MTNFGTQIGGGGTSGSSGTSGTSGYSGPTGLLFTVNFKGLPATVTCPIGQWVYDGTNYVDPYKAKRVALSLNLDPTGTVVAAVPVTTPLAHGGAAVEYDNAAFTNILICEVLSVATITDATVQVVNATPINGEWVLYVPPGTVRDVIPTPTVS